MMPGSVKLPTLFRTMIANEFSRFNVAQNLRSAFLFSVFVCVAFSLTACESLSWYGQAAKGQYKLLAEKQAVEELLEHDATPPELKKKLQLTQEILAFAEKELFLKVDGNYQDYVQLADRYPVWNIYAAETLSLTPFQWCYLLVGCVSYRGYFEQEKAWEKALELQQQGLEVFVHGVSAYSTLGWFNDPLLSSFIYRSETELARLIFHELTHSVLYISDDTAFNESFAEAVSQEALKRWFAYKGQAEKFEQFQDKEQSQQAFNQLLMKTRDELNALFNNAGMSDQEKLKQKDRIYLSLFANYQEYKQQYQTEVYDYWMNDQMNNAKLAIMGDYFQWVPAFSAILENYPGDEIQNFYKEVERLSRLNREVRYQYLRSQEI